MWKSEYCFVVDCCGFCYLSDLIDVEWVIVVVMILLGWYGGCRWFVNVSEVLNGIF